MFKPTHAVLIAIYKMKLSESPTFKSLLKQGLTDTQVIIYDNSPLNMCDVYQDNHLIYYHDPKNKGLFVAYNYAVTFCRVNQIQWLTIFDQDTVIPAVFFQTLKTHLHNEVCCIVPRVELENHKQISPFIIENTIFPFKVKKNNNSTIAAINSGNTINVNFFPRKQALFTKEFPLDFLDYDFFKRVAELQGNIEMLSATLTQNLSVADYHTVSNTRFLDFLSYESKFVRLYYPDNLKRYHIKLILRACKLFAKGFQITKIKLIIKILRGYMV